MRRSELVQMLAVRPDDQVVVAVGGRRMFIRGMATDRATGDIVLLTQSIPSDELTLAHRTEADPMVRRRNGLPPLPDWNDDTGGARTHPYVD